MKQTKLFMGIALLIQAVTLLFASLAAAMGKKGGFGLFLGSVASGALGTYLVYKDAKSKQEDMDFGDEDFDECLCFDDDECDGCDCGCKDDESEADDTDAGTAE